MKNMWRKRLTGILVTSLAIFSASACNVSTVGEFPVQGRVLDEVGNPIANATVFIAGKSATTDVFGKYLLDYNGNPNDLVGISALGPGYAQVIRRLVINPNYIGGYDFILRPVDIAATVNLIPGAAPISITITHGVSQAVIYLDANTFVTASSVTTASYANLAKGGFQQKGGASTTGAMALPAGTGTTGTSSTGTTGSSGTTTGSGGGTTGSGSGSGTSSGGISGGSAATTGSAGAGNTGSIMTGGTGVSIGTGGSVSGGSVSGGTSSTTGGPANGNVIINATFWEPGQTMASNPGEMLANDPNTNLLTALVSQGMFTLTATQNGEVLQINPAVTLTVTVKVSPEVKAQIASQGPPGTEGIYSHMFYLQESPGPDIGTWVLEPAATLSYDATQGIFTAQLPHLTSWNIDQYVFALPDGGCARGRVINQCGNPVPNQNVFIMSPSYEDTGRFPATTDTNGNYCIDTGDYARGGQYMPYFISDAANPNNTSMCNPLPADATNTCYLGNGADWWTGACSSLPIDCFSPDVCPNAYGTCSPDFSSCSAPNNNPSGGSCYDTAGNPQTCAGSTCTMPAALIQPCAFCGTTGTGAQSPEEVAANAWAIANQNNPICYNAGTGNFEVPNFTNCAPLATITIRDSHSKSEGQTCGPQDCCVPNPGEPALQCSDQICVPVQ